MLKKAERQYEIDLLKIFDWLRFPLIIGVIFIHNYSIKSTCCISDNWGGVFSGVVFSGNR